eukprot:10523936-Karenia_brevis.AAC.1
MATVCAEIQSEYRDLMQFGHSCTCVACQKPMEGPTIRTWDAGQAYEVLSPSCVLQDLDFVIKRSEDTRCGLLQ